LGEKIEAYFRIHDSTPGLNFDHQAEIIGKRLNRLSNYDFVRTGGRSDYFCLE
jgi:hypothetical protein